MNNLYRRIVTMGMISFSAILAWVYCVLAYREKTVYVVCLSLVLVISLYALANAIISLHLTKQNDMRNYISYTVNATLANLIPNPAEKQEELDRLVEADRLAKATYVQLRKVNTNLTSLTEANSYNSVKSIDNYTALTLSLKEAVTEAIANTAKIIIKYNKTDNQNIIEALNELTNKMQDITQALDDISTRIDSINIVAQPHVKTPLEDSVMDDTLPEGIDVFSVTTSTPKDTAPDITVAEEEAAVSSFFDEFGSAEEPSTDTDSQDATTSSNDPNQILSPDDIAALFAAAMPATESEDASTTTETADVAEEVAEAPVVNDDPNRPLTPEEIEALFSASAPANEPEPVVEEVAEAPAVNDDPNRPLTPEEIAALFSASAPANEPEPETEEDKIIPFPVSEEIKEEEPAPIAEEFDPNKQLSPDEIAALFASINGGN